MGSAEMGGRPLDWKEIRSRGRPRSRRPHFHHPDDLRVLKQLIPFIKNLFWLDVELFLPNIKLFVCNVIVKLLITQLRCPDTELNALGMLWWPCSPLLNNLLLLFIPRATPIPPALQA